MRTCQGKCLFFLKEAVIGRAAWRNGSTSGGHESNAHDVSILIAVATMLNNMASLVAEPGSGIEPRSDRPTSIGIDQAFGWAQRASELIDLTGRSPPLREGLVIAECELARMAILFNLGVISEVCPSPTALESVEKEDLGRLNVVY